MPTPQREPLRKLSRSEHTALERIVRKNNERVDLVRRANALLTVAGTGVFIHAAHEAGLRSGTTVADLVARFNRRGLAALRIATGAVGGQRIQPASVPALSPQLSANRADARMGRPPGP